VIIFGHSHTPYHQRIDKTLLFNPGSLAGINRTYGILRLEDEEIWADVKELR
jgi:predicted phosphodiesterase